MDRVPAGRDEATMQTAVNTNIERVFERLDVNLGIHRDFLSR